jgi:Phage P22-like portal protein
MKKETVLERAKKRFEVITKEYAYTHKIAKKCHDFVAGEQWSKEAEKSRGDAPTLTINKLSSSVNNVVNKSSMESLNIQILPFEDDDSDNARVKNGLLRHIQYSDKSDAAVAFNNGLFDLVVGGFGYWRIDSDFISEDSFDQELSIEPIDDPFGVYIDKGKQYAFCIKCISEDEYKEKYGDELPKEWDTTQYISKSNEGDVLLLEYWEISKEKVTIHKIEILEEIPAPEEEIDIEKFIGEITEPKTDRSKPKYMVVTDEELESIPEYVINSSRESYKKIVKQYILSADKILETNDWDGNYIPIIGVYSRKFVTDEGWFWKPLVYDSLDAQTLYNYERSQNAEILMQAPLAPWVGYEGQFDGHETEFSEAHKSRVGYIESKPVVIGGQVLPHPQRQMPPQGSQSYVQSMMQASDEIQATMGIFDSSIGARSNEVTGKAILAREEQGDVTTYHFALAMKQGYRETGLIAIDLIPHKYDTARTIRILGDDMEDEIVKINEEFIDKKTGEVKRYDMEQGSYDLKITTGTSNITRKMDTAENLLNFAKTLPQSGGVIGDLIAKNLTFDNSEELADRLKATIDPAIFARMKQMKDETENGGNGVDPQQQMIMQKFGMVQQQLVGAQQTIQQLATENKALKNREVQSRIQIAQIQANSDMRKQQMQDNTDIRIAQMNNQNDIQEEIIRRQPIPGQPMYAPPLKNNAVPAPSGQQVRVTNNRPLGQ